ncbi:unnamed protein product, partial [marine sediment metagenome]
MGGIGFIVALVQITLIVMPYILPAKKQKGHGGPRMGDQLITSSAYGTGINIVYGTARVSGVLIWTAGITEVKETFGKNWLGQGGQTAFEYFCTFAIALCEGEAGAILKVIMDNKVVIDNTGKD